MEPRLKGCLRAITLELRRVLEGSYDSSGKWQARDLERRLGEIGVWRDRPPNPLDEIVCRTPEDARARCVVDAFVGSRAEAGLARERAVEEFVREAAYTWANRLLALRCMEARGLIDEVILQKEAYGGRSLQHWRLAKRSPERCTGEDEGLFAVLFDEFERRAAALPLLFDPGAPEVALRPSVQAIKRCIALLSGTEALKGQDRASDEVFTLPASKEHLDAFLRKHPEDALLKPALLAIFEGLAHADEIGSLLQIEEPVERGLRYLRDRQGPQRDWLGPNTDAEWAAWKTSALERLAEHFDAEASATDLGAAFFGEAGARGVSLVDMLSRRYDVVATNPPYMGSKNVGPVLKRHVERHFAAGKRDLYAAFILRCTDLAARGGRVAMSRSSRGCSSARSPISVRSTTRSAARRPGRSRASCGRRPSRPWRTLGSTHSRRPRPQAPSSHSSSCRARSRLPGIA